MHTYTHVCMYIVCFPHFRELTAEKKKCCCPLSDVYTFHPRNMSKMILWLNPGKNVKNAWLDTCFSSKNTTVLINCSTWRSLFNMMYSFVLAWDYNPVWIQVFLGFQSKLNWLDNMGLRASSAHSPPEDKWSASPLNCLGPKTPAGVKTLRCFLNTLSRNNYNNGKKQTHLSPCQDFWDCQLTDLAARKHFRGCVRKVRCGSGWIQRNP